MNWSSLGVGNYELDNDILLRYLVVLYNFLFELINRLF